MKVITEERLRELAELTMNVDGSAALRFASYECQEIDQLTVTKLRPMSEAPRTGEYIRAYFETGYPKEWCDAVLRWNENFKAWEEYNRDANEECYQDSNFHGWIPMPLYKPEQS